MIIGFFSSVTLSVGRVLLVKEKKNWKKTDLFQRYLDGPKKAEIFVNFDFPVNVKTIFQIFNCNVTVFLLLSFL